MSLELQLECPYCLDVFVRPVSLPCGHSLCRDCAHKIKRKGNQCPICHLSLPSELRDNLVLCSIVNDWRSRHDSLETKGSKEKEPEPHRRCLRLRRKAGGGTPRRENPITQAIHQMESDSTKSLPHPGTLPDKGRRVNAARARRSEDAAENPITRALRELGVVSGNSPRNRTANNKASKAPPAANKSKAPAAANPIAAAMKEQHHMSRMAGKTRSMDVCVEEPMAEVGCFLALCCFVVQARSWEMGQWLIRSCY